MQFTGTETNGQLNRIITLVVVPPSGEQLRGTNLVVQPNIIIKPTSTNYPLVSVVSADYDVYLAGLKQVFRIAVPDTNVVQRWDLLLKDGLTTYNYTNPLPRVDVTNILVTFNNIYSTDITAVTINATTNINNFDYTTNLFVTTNYTQTSFITNLYGPFITNFILYSTNIITTNLFATFITNNTLFSTNVYTTNLTVNFITNNTLYSTNVFATNISSISNYFAASKGGTIVVTNASFNFITNNYQITTNLLVSYLTNNIAYITNLTANFITNNYAYITNLFTTNLVANTITNNTFVTTNVTINAPGGLTNFNATPKTVAWWDALDTAGSIPNSSGFLTNNGSGDIGWSTVLALTELDAQNAYLTNTFIFITNKFAYPDSNGQFTGLANASGVLQNDGSGGFSWVAAPAPGGSAGGELAGTYPNPTFAKLVVTNGENQAITVSNQFRVDAAHAFVVSNSTASSLLSNDGAHNVTNAGVSARMSFTGNVLDLSSTPYANGINFTNEGFGLPTNNVGGAALVFGGPGTAATLYDTNITAATTLKLFDITACGATAGGIKIHVTCSGGTDRILTFPAGCTGAGYGTPPAITITNGVAPKGAMIDVIYTPGAVPMTNVFWSPIF